ncbi:MAG: dephospho-CoA kinase, partial [Candidatus Margulisiibacteriota bacterium]
AIVAGQVDRVRLARLVFPGRIRELNAIIHPKLRALIRSQVIPNTVIHAALLDELGLRALSDKVLLVSARQSTILSRLSVRLYPRQILKRLRTQHSDHWYRRHSDLILYNNGTLVSLKEQVLTLCQTLF